MRIATLFIASLLQTSLLMASEASPAPPDSALDAAIASPLRDAKAAARDSARHPAQVLRFFQLSAAQNVVELWPATGYWTEILAPYLAAQGHYTAVLAPRSDEE